MDDSKAVEEPLILEGKFILRHSWASNGFITSEKALNRYLANEETKEDDEAEETKEGPMNEEEETKENPVPVHFPSLATPPQTEKRLWVFFDFDNTLCTTVASDGVKRWNRETHCKWGFPEWLVHPGSLLLPGSVTPGPALKHFQEYASAGNCQVVILTARAATVEPTLRHVLSDPALFPQPPANPVKFLCKPPNDSRPNPSYKANAVLRCVRENDAAKRVVLFEDQEDALEAMQLILSRNGYHVESHLVDAKERTVRNTIATTPPRPLIPSSVEQNQEGWHFHVP